MPEDRTGCGRSQHGAETITSSFETKGLDVCAQLGAIAPAKPKVSTQSLRPMAPEVFTGYGRKPAVA